MKIEIPFDQLHESFGDPELLLNMRNWLQESIEKNRAKITGKGMGMGGADIDFTLDGYPFVVSIHPLPIKK